MDCEKQPLNHRCLRIHAINWIKEIKEGSKKAWDSRMDYIYTDDDKRENMEMTSSFEVGGMTIHISEEESEEDGMIKFIQHFFNITNEELNDSFRGN